MSGFVCVDAGVAVKWVVPEELQAQAVKLYSDSIGNDVRLVAAPHFLVEVTNALRKKVRLHGMPQARAQEALTNFLDLKVQLFSELQVHAEALRLAGQFDRPSIYDTHYIAVAAFLECDFWTDDSKLVNSLRGRLPFVRLLRDYA